MVEAAVGVGKERETGVGRVVGHWIVPHGDYGLGAGLVRAWWLCNLVVVGEVVRADAHATHLGPVIPRPPMS